MRLFWAATILIAFSSHLGAQTPGNSDSVPQSALFYGSHFPSNREHERLLEVAKELLEQRRSTDAIRLLDQILAAKEDSFDNAEKSLKQQAASLLRTLSESGRRSLDAMHLDRLSREVRIALSKGDRETLAELAARFPPETIGTEAWSAWAWLEQERGNYAVADTLYEELLRNAPPVAIDRVAPWARSAAEANRERLARDAPEVSPVGSAHRQWASRHHPVQWLGEGGGPDKNAMGIGPEPTPWRAWRALLDQKPYAEQARGELLRRLPTTAAILTAPNAVAVGDLLIASQGGKLIAINATNGLRCWEALLGGQPPSPRTRAEWGEAPPAPQEAPLAEIAWLDRVRGTLSSDARSVFAITGPLATSQDRQPGQAGFGFLPISTGKRTNGLVAHDLATEGKLSWRLDGSDTSSPVAGVRFLAPPVPRGDLLAQLVAQEGMVSFLLIEASMGKVLWRQPLVSSDGAHGADALRRIGVSPSWAGHLVICPTGRGVVVAIDPYRRAIAWSTRLPIDALAMRGNNVREARERVRAADSRARNGRGWRAARAIIVNDGVVVATPESDRLHCFERNTGEIRWSRPIKQGTLLTCVSKGSVLLIESNALSAWSLDRGERIWRASLPKNDRPAGEGVLLGQEYVLPLISGKFAQIHLHGGSNRNFQLTKAGINPLDVPGSLGNLICHAGALYSRSPGTIERYDQPRSGDEPTLANELALAERELERGDLKAAHTRFAQIASEQPERRDLKDRLHAVTAIALRDGTTSGGTLTQEEPTSKGTIRQALFRFHDAVRRGNAPLATHAAEELLAKTEGTQPYVSPSPGHVVLLSKWIAGTLARLEGEILTPPITNLADTPSGPSSPLDEGWSTRQVVATMTLEEGTARSTRTTVPFSRASRKEVSVRLRMRVAETLENRFFSWVVRNTRGETQELVGRNQSGEIVFAERLPEKIAGMLTNASLGTPAICSGAQRLLLQVGDRLVAYDIGPRRGKDRMAWTTDTTPNELYTAIPLYDRRASKNLLATKPRHKKQSDQAYGMDAGGAVIRREGGVECRASENGQVSWRRQDLGQYEQILVTSDRVYLASSRQPTGMVISKWDGHTLGTWSVPQGDWHAFSEENLLVIQANTASLHDLSSDAIKPLWSQSLDDTLHITDEETLFLLSREGVLQGIDTSTARASWESKLDLLPHEIRTLQVFTLDNSLFVSVGSQDKNEHRQEGITPVGSYPLLTGKLFCLDRQTGHPLWPHPVELERVGLLAPQVKDPPFLCFAGRVEAGPANMALNHLVVIDTATGRSLYRHDELPASRPGRITHRVLRETVPQPRLLIQLGSVHLQLDLTDQPSPPRPPMRSRIELPHDQTIDLARVQRGLDKFFEQIVEPLDQEVP